jgi:H+/Cl- antiporter ClcA
MFFTLHILLMILATLGFITGVSAAIFFRKNKHWLNFHRKLNLLSLMVTILGIIMAVTYITDSSGTHLNGLHHKAGLTTFLIASAAVFFGFHQIRGKNKKTLKAFHRWTGRMTLLMFVFVIVLGLKLTNII